MGYMQLFGLKSNLHYHWLNHPIFLKRNETEITVLKRWLKLLKLIFNQPFVKQISTMVI